MLYNWLNIITVFLSLTGGAYGIVLLSQLRNKYNHPWINSLFFYQILIYLFGIYGLLGNALVRNVLLKFEVNVSGIESVTRLIPFLGLPLMISAWFLLIKCIADLFDRKLKSFVTISYFILFTLAFFVYGILLNKLNATEQVDFTDTNSRIRFAFYTSELLITAIVIIYTSINLPGIKNKNKLIYTLRLVGLLTIWVILKSIGLHFLEYHYFIKLYYLLLFFTGFLPIIFLSKLYLSANFSTQDTHTSTSQSHFASYNITPREREIIQEICKGKTNKQIADDLFITLQTVKDHTHNIYKKTGVKNRVQLVQLFSV